MTETVEVTQAGEWRLTEDEVGEHSFMTLFQGERMVAHFCLKGSKQDAEHILRLLAAEQAQSAQLQEALAEVEGLLFRIRRTSEMSANIMRDARRTGGWEGSEKTARQFDRLAKYATQAEALTTENKQ